MDNQEPKGKEMKIGIAVFAYCRKDHLRRVLNALKENGAEKLYIFQDGLKNDAHKEGWLQTDRKHRRSRC